MRAQLKSVGRAALIAASLFCLLINTNWVNAKVVCVDKYNYARVIPCSDQNAIAAPAGGNMTAASNIPRNTNVTKFVLNGNMSAVNMTKLGVGGAPIPPGGENATGPSISTTFRGVTLPYTGFCPNGNWTAKVADDSNGEFVEDAQYDFYYTHYHYVYCYVPGEHGDRGPFVNPRTGLYEPSVPTSSSAPTNTTTTSLSNMRAQGGMCPVGLMNATPVPCDQVQKQREINAGIITVPSPMNKTAGMNATSTAAGMNATSTAAGMNKTVGMNATTNPAGLPTPQTTTANPCHQLQTTTAIVRACLSWGETHLPNPSDLISNGGRSGHGHTAAYLDGYKQGKTDMQNRNPIDAAATCDSFGFGNNKDWSHCVAGYDDAISGRYLFF